MGLSRLYCLNYNLNSYSVNFNFNGNDGKQDGRDDHIFFI